MNKNDKIVEGKNDLRNYQFEHVKKGKRIYSQIFPGSYQEFTNFFYTKKCLYCGKEFEGKRVDATFCCQGCQKARMRLRRK
ncbi:hypothetical protein [Spirosoma panaciterrae]|uniref:hypothetical protein n=1 Tax=Spirosoma panaciterrae TaxID=496058 RepID=UPI000368074C|nr:hypothetical protein [Spirosoma panaciterrae]